MAEPVHRRRPALRRYWFRFAVTLADHPPLGVMIGVGVTARSRTDAERLIAARVFGPRPFPPITACVADVDVATLDPNHVHPNMGDPSRRGVWFPLGYDGEP